ncbi:unnamed protein product, partial [Ixodes pacificus]
TSDGDGACPSSWSRERPFNTDSAAQEEAPAASLLTWPTWSLTDNNRTMAHRGTFPFPSVGCLQKHLPPLQSLGHDKAMPALTLFMTQVSYMQNANWKQPNNTLPFEMSCPIDTKRLLTLSCDAVIFVFYCKACIEFLRV